MKSTTLIIIVLMVLFTFQSCTSQDVRIEDYNASLASDFNQLIIETAIAEDNLLTMKGVRSASMMHVAMHDALNSIVPKYEYYAYHTEAPDANPIAAAAYAAYSVAINQYPDKKEAFKKILDKHLSNVEDSETKAKGKTLGEDAAEAILKKREGDKWNGQADYTFHPMAPGVYAEFNEHSGTPEGFIFGAGLAVIKPFLLPNYDHFKAPPPPEINSEAYTKAFNEVKELGRYDSKTRTKDEAHLAMWWKEFGESSHNKLLRDLIKKENPNLWDAARSFALMNMVIFDGYVNVFYNKFHYNHWRPYTAIRWAAHDGNDNTEPEVEWNNLHKHTYPFPSYPSAHGTASTAAMTVLANTFGKGDDYKFTMVQKEVDSAGFFSGRMKMDPPTRNFNSFSEAGLEASMSRVYLGIHFRYDSEEGNKLGAKIGNYASDNFLKPL
ncbi:vanadium-dependent haloperoxidase [Flagellimonas meridianipacifica]|uniref:PAP2 superfamily protein n=1 Tax=Flagellimonas meridianipacifica TaxID=1080225 RepID=A0A2T0MGV4_9FLAO|nr:vanadium-dependent haloperoxidase [Allomuricauda pacifica]PRX56795.1 PAP2 superfamily protein [Allomuricauda pacifica]